MGRYLKTNRVLCCWSWALIMCHYLHVRVCLSRKKVLLSKLLVTQFFFTHCVIHASCIVMLCLSETSRLELQPLVHRKYLQYWIQISVSHAIIFAIFWWWKTVSVVSYPQAFGEGLGWVCWAVRGQSQPPTPPAGNSMHLWGRLRERKSSNLKWTKVQNNHNIIC